MGTLSVGSLAMMNISGRAASSGGDNGSATSFVTLFQGDSITDGNRGRTQDPNHILGHGYASHVASTLGALHPERNLSFLNRGISGDTVASLQARWKSDALALRPDVISLLIGVNDILHRIKSGTTKKPSSSHEELRQLLEQTKGALPETKLVLCQPFILRVGMVAEKPDVWIQEIETVQAASERLAKEFDCCYVPFQKAFDDALSRAPADYWIWDGIHPTYNGHGLMAMMWMEVVGKAITQLAR